MLKSDHRLLEFIFNHRKVLSKVTAARISRWMLIFIVFDFDILYVKGSTIPLVDALSRLTFVNEQKEVNEDTAEI